MSLRPQQFPDLANSAVQTIAKRRPPFEFLILGVPSLVLCQCFRVYPTIVLIMMMVVVVVAIVFVLAIRVRMWVVYMLAVMTVVALL